MQPDLTGNCYLAVSWITCNGTTALLGDVWQLHLCVFLSDIALSRIQFNIITFDHICYLSYPQGGTLQGKGHLCSQSLFYFYSVNPWVRGGGGGLSSVIVGPLSFDGKQLKRDDSILAHGDGSIVTATSAGASDVAKGMGFVSVVKWEDCCHRCPLLHTSPVTGPHSAPAGPCVTASQPVLHCLFVVL